MKNEWGARRDEDEKWGDLYGSYADDRQEKGRHGPSREDTIHEMIAHGYTDGPFIEVVPQSTLWRIRGAGEHDEVFKDRGRAVAVARHIAREQEAMLTIFDEDGEIEEQQDYGTMGVRPSPEVDLPDEIENDPTFRVRREGTLRR